MSKAKPDPNKAGKTTRFEDETTTIPVSKNYLYDYRDDEIRKDTQQEFRSKRSTYIGAIVVGTIVVIVGSILIWVGSHYSLNDFYIIGPATLIMGCGMAGVGLILLLRGLFKMKRANLTVVQGSAPVSTITKPEKPKSANLSERSYIAASEVSVHGLNSRIGSANNGSLVDVNSTPQSRTETPVSTVFDSGGDHDKTGNSNSLYNSREIETSPVPKVAAGHKVNITLTSGNSEAVTGRDGLIYHISVPNETIFVGPDALNEDTCSIPDAVEYLEPRDYCVESDSIPDPALYFSSNDSDSVIESKL